MTKKILTLAASMALLGTAGCGSDCDSKECPVSETDGGIIDTDAGIPEKSDVMKYLETISSLLKKNIVRIASCSTDTDSIKGKVEPYMALLEPALPMLEEVLVNDRLTIKWEKVRPCLDEILPALMALDAAADQGDICSLMSKNLLLSMVTRDKIPQCSKMIEDIFSYVSQHQAEFDWADLNEDTLGSIYAFLPYIAEPNAKLGDECVFDYECKDGFCAGNTALTCGGICVPFKKEGEPCVMNQQCGDGMGCFQHKCTPHGTKAGDLCGTGLACGDGFVCSKKETCAPVIPDGQKNCLTESDCDSDYCASGLSNDDDICTAKAANGKPCNSSEDCKSDFCDHNHPGDSTHNGTCADEKLLFPGDACGAAGSNCMSECDMSLDTPVCTTSYKESDDGGECSDYDECKMFSECIGLKRDWNSETQTYVVKKKGTCKGKLSKGDKCEYDEDLCKSSLDCRFDDPDAEITTDASGNLIYPDSHCVASYVELGEMCYDSLDERDSSDCNPTTSFCDVATDAEKAVWINLAVEDTCPAPISDECRKEVTDALSDISDDESPRFCHALKKNYESCSAMNECASGYCDILGGSYLCMDFPDISQVNICQLPGLYNLVFSMGGMFGR